jgi:hypothetical protein
LDRKVKREIQYHTPTLAGSTEKARGSNMDHLVRVFEHLVARLDGPLHFRLIFQPLMSVIFAVRDGRTDAREGRAPFRLFTEPGQRREVLLSSLKSVGKVFVIGLILDAIYQFLELRWFYPGEALLVALILAVLPYFLLRGTVNQLTRRIVKRKASH